MLDLATCDYVANSFSGNFDGNGHKILNLRMRIDNAIEFGFIGSWTPAAGGYIRDVEFVNPEIGGGNRVGVVIGAKPSAGVSTLTKVRVKGMDLEGRGGAGQVGGIVGYADGLNLIDVRSQGLMRTEGDSIGGIVGHLDNSTILTQLKSNTRIDTMSSQGTPLNVAGVVGNLFSGGLTTFSLISHEGLIRTQANLTGGLFGFVNVNLVLNDFYANTAVYLAGPHNHSFGGIAGSYSGPNPARGYFSGHVIDECAPTAAPSCSRATFSASSSPSDFLYMSGSIPTSPGTTVAQGTPVSNDESGIFGTVPAFLSTGNWVKTARAMPRLLWEQHPCALTDNSADLSAQTGRGSSANPFTICSPMHWNELVNLAPQGQETFYQVLTPVNLIGAQYQTGMIESNVHLRGTEGALLFGADMINTQNSLLSANHGKMTKLDFANIYIKSTSGGQTVRGLLTDNHGTIEDVNIFSGFLDNDGPVYGVLLNNQSTGIIRRMIVDLNIKTASNLYGFAHQNMYDSANAKGVIDDIRLFGRFEGTAANQSIRGFLDDNNGIINKVTIGTHFGSNSSLEYNEVTAFVANNGFQGEISNIHISPHARWHFRIGGGGSNSILVINNGMIKNVLDEGEFFHVNATATTLYSDAFNGISGLTSSSNAQGVISVPSGRRIDSFNTTFSCTGTDVTVPMPSAPFNGAYFSGGDLETSNKTVWLKLKYDGDQARYFAANTHFVAGANITFSIPTLTTDDCTNLNEVTLIQGHRTTAVQSAPFFDETSYNNFEISLFNSGDWDPANVDVLDTSNPVANPAPFERMLSIIAHYLGAVVQPPPPAIPDWEYEGDRMRIFRLN